MPFPKCVVTLSAAPVAVFRLNGVSIGCDLKTQRQKIPFGGFRHIRFAILIRRMDRTGKPDLEHQAAYTKNVRQDGDLIHILFSMSRFIKHVSSPTILNLYNPEVRVKVSLARNGPSQIGLVSLGKYIPVSHAR